ncbi:MULTISPECIES: methyltransferase family protein [Anaerostipes]|uniref:methyltransferase family protein n=1 Tax=Anaerostipes TaxID=207244 RepID=UPI000950CC6C|nr:MULTISPECIES: methyltransferase [unclassified Anaerostipes]MDY2726304.1 methyltransferase [Anaerostipes faecalis]
MFENISENILIQDGVYGWVRNPVYSAAFFISMGAVCMTNRLLLLVVVGMICWSYMSLLLVVTEEKWLRELYGKQYEAYFHSVNRCIPWFSKK